MADRRRYLKVRSEITLDRFGLGWRFDDYQVSCHSSALPPWSRRRLAAAVSKPPKRGRVGKREQLARMLNHDSFQLKLQHQVKHGLSIKSGTLDKRINVQSVGI